jgi:hypothetical protein
VSDRFDLPASYSIFATKWRSVPGRRFDSRINCLTPAVPSARTSRNLNLRTAGRLLGSKDAIALKESKETKFWLRLSEAKSLGQPELRRWLLQEADEFVAMLTVGVKNLQR